MTPSERAPLIAKYKAGYDEVKNALAGITAAEWDHRPGPGKWSARETVHHLGDSEMMAAMRVRLLLAEDRPKIQAYDQDEFARRLHYDRPPEASLEAFRIARRSTAELLDRLTEAEWAREGTHSERGHYSVEIWLTSYAKHAFTHADQIRRARAARS